MPSTQDTRENKPISQESIGRGVIWSAVNQSIGQLLVLAVFLVTARFISKEDFGTMAVCLLIFELFRQISVESIGTTLLASANPSDADYNTGFILANLMSILSAICMFSLAYPISFLMDNASLTHAIQLTSIMLVALGLSKIQETWLMRNMQFKNLAIRSIIASVCGGIIGIYMAVRGHGLNSLITQQIVTTLVGSCLLWLITKWKPSKNFNLSSINEFFNYSKHVSLNSVAAVVSSQSSIFVSSYYLGPAATGILSAANRLLLALQNITTASISFVALPALSSFGDDLGNLRKAYLNCVLFTAAFTLPMLIGFSILSEDIIILLLGEKWADAAPIISILCISTFLWSIDQFNTHILLIKKKPHWLTMQTILHALINVLILIIMAPYGILYVAIGMVFKTLITMPITLSISFYLIGLKPTTYLRKISPVVIASALMGISIYILKHCIPPTNHAINVLVSVPSGITVYLGALLLFSKSTLMQFYKILNAVIMRRT